MSYNLEKSFSLSKYNTLKDCPKKYYYTYYLSNGVCDPSENDFINQAKRLKKLSNRYFYSGKIIHDVAKDLISNQTRFKPSSIDIDSLKLKAIKYFRSTCVNDLNIFKNDLCINDDIKLMEYFYGDEINTSQGKNTVETIESCINNLLNTTTFSEIKNKDVSLIENVEESYNNFIFNSMKTYAVLDLLYKDNLRGKYVIVDWKTSAKEDANDKKQQLLYALYVMSKYKVSIDDIICRCEYLRDGSYKEYNFNTMDVDAFILKFNKMLNDINGYLDNIDMNIPKAPDTFIHTTNTKVCSLCAYKQLCSGYSINLESSYLCNNI